MEVYLGEYKQEKWGFSSALANGISLTWINIISFRFIFFNGVPEKNLRFLIVLIFFIYGFFIIYNSFSHHIHDKYNYILAGPTTIYFFSFVSILWGQGVLEINGWIALDLLITFLAVLGIFYIIKKGMLGLKGEVEAIKKGEIPVELEDKNKNLKI